MYKIWNEQLTTPLIANIPHNSSVIPANERAAFSISDTELREEVRLLTDWYTDELYAPVVDAGGFAISSQVSRFVVDMERFSDDSQEVMAKRGMGVLYTHGCSNQIIRPSIAAEERERLLATYYRPYHQRLIDATKKALVLHGRVTIIDCHSYPEKALPYEIDPNAPRADIVLGTDPHHTPQATIEMIRHACAKHGYSFACDRPFAGTYVPLPYYKDPRVSAWMLEINRKTYLNERDSALHAGFSEVKSLIQEIVAGLN